MSEPTKRARAIRRLVDQLWKIGNKADDLGLVLQNGANLGSLLGSAAADLEAMIEDGQFDSEAA